MIIKTKITNELTPALAKAAGDNSMTQLHGRLGKRLEYLLREHFADKQAQGNKQGWSDVGFWDGTSGVAQKTVLTDVSASNATVTIADPRLAHKISGGRITAKRGKNLAIPLTEEARDAATKGRIRDTMPGLFCIRTAKGPWLVRSRFENVAGKTIARNRLEFLFKLTPSVNQDPDNTAMPNDAAVERGLQPILDDFIKRIGKS